MNKKKIARISAVVVSTIVIIAAGIVGVNAYIRHRNLATTGNILGVEWYNETDPQFTITTVEQLYELAELSDFYNFKGQTIKLGADLVVNEGNAEDWAEDAPAKRWNPITGFAGIFDGQNHTISGLYGKGFERRMALFADTDMSCSVKNLSLVNSYFETTGHRGTASIVSHGGGKFKKIYSDAIIVHKGENVGGIASTIDAQSTFEECWFAGNINITSRDCGGIIDEVLGARVTVKHCLFSGYIYSSYDVGGTRTGGIFGRTDKAATIVLSDSLSSGTIECEKKVYTGAMLGASYNGVQFTIENTYASTETYGTAIGESGNKGTFTGTALQLSASELTGVKAYQWTTLNFDSYWAVVEDGTPILKCFAETVPSLEGVKKVYDTSWYIPGGFDFTLMTREQLYGFFIMSASTDYKDCKVKLGADIVVNEGDASKWAKEAPEMPWFPIATFAGQFDGQGHTISGLYTKTSGSYVGIFGQATAPSVIQNVSLKNSYFEKTGTSAAFMGSIVGDTYGIIQNVYSNAIIVSEGNQVGGIVGRLNDNDKTMSNMRIDGEDYSVMSNCWFDGSIKMLAWEEENTGACEAGGLVGRVVQGDAIIEHCLNSGTISSNVTGRALMVGGLVGYVVNAGQLQITDCLSVGEIKTDYTICVGSVIGRGNTAERIITVKDTYATKESFEKAAISKNSLKSTVKGDVICVDKSWIEGNKGYQFTTLDFDKYWTVVVGPDGTPILSQFASKKPSVKGLAKMVDTSWYKVDAKEMVIDSVADLYGLAMLSSATNFSEQTIKLAGDITVNPVDAATLATWVNRTAAPEYGWITIGSSSKPFAGTFDGQGHTIRGIYSVSEAQYNGLFGATTPTSMIKNLSLVDSYFAFTGSNLTEEGKEAAAYMGSIAGDLRGDMDSVYSNAIVTSTANQVGGLVGRANGAKGADGNLTTSTINNCWFDGQVILTGETARYAGGIAAIAVQGTIEITNCLNTGSISNERDNAGQFLGGILGTEWTACTVNIKGCLNTGSVTAKYVNSVGSIVGRIQKKDSKFNITDTYATKESCVNSAGKPATIGSRAAGAKEKGAAGTISEAMLSGYGGYQYTMLDFDKYWTVVVEPDGTPILKTFASSTPSVAGKESIRDWYRADAKVMEIDSVVDLYGFSVLSEVTDFADQTVKLTKSVQLDPNVEWLPIGSTKAFAGTFDGGMNTISGMYVDNDTSYIGMFAITSPTSMVKNFYLKDSKFSYSGPSTYIDDEGAEKESGAYIGSIVGDLRGDMDSVYSNAIVTSTANQAGGLVSRANGAKDANGKLTTCTINNCWFDGQVILTGETARYAGGIAGIAVQGTIEITNCLNSGSVSNERDNAGQFLGGILGTEWTACTVNIEGCLNTGSVTATYVNSIGSIIGRIQKKDSKINITDTYATKESCVNSAGKPATIGSRAAGVKENGTAGTIYEDMLSGYGGYSYTMLDFDKYWAVVVNPDETPVLKTFAKSAPSLKGQESIQDWYRADAKTMEIDSVVDLYGFSVLSEVTDFAGQTVKLTKSVQLDPNVEWLPIGSTSKPFAGTFDGGMNTITGMYVDNDTSYIGMFAVTSPTSMVQRFYLVDSEFIYSGPSTYIADDGDKEESNAYIGSIAGDLRGDLDTVYSKSTVTSTANRVGGLVGCANGAKGSDGKLTTCTINNSWFDGQVILTGNVARYAGGIAGIAMQGTIEISNCLNTGSVSNERDNAGQYLGGIIGTEWNACTVNITGCVSAGSVTAPNNINCIGSIAGRVDDKSTYNVTNTYAVKGKCVDKNGADKTIWGSRYTNGESTLNNKTSIVTEEQLTGTDPYLWTQLDFDKYWTYRADNITALTSFVGAPTSNGIAGSTKWYEEAGENATEYHINSEEDFYGFMKLVNDGVTFEGATIYLEKSLNLNELEQGKENETVEKWQQGVVPTNKWRPIGNSNNRFAGTFDGQMNRISGVYANLSSTDVGLFGATAEGSLIKNLELQYSYFNSTKTGTVRMGSIVGELSGSIDTVYSNAIVDSVGEQVGGLVGVVNDTNEQTNEQPGDGKDVVINNCWFEGEVNLSGEAARRGGGIVGYAQQGNTTISNTLFDGTVTCTDPVQYTFIGGVIGGNNSGENQNISISGCLSVGTLDVPTTTSGGASTDKGVGCIIGTINGSATAGTSISYSVDNCYFTETNERDKAYANKTSGTNATNVSAFTTELMERSYLTGNAGYTWTKLDFKEEKIWAVRKNDFPALASFVDGEDLTDVYRCDTDWYKQGEEKDGVIYYHIEDENDFYGLTKLVKQGKTFKDTVVYLDNNLDLKGHANEWVPIGNADTRFAGTFDGQMNQISGAHVDTTGSYVGLFGATAEGAVIKNLILTEDCYFATTDTDYAYIGSVAGELRGRLDTVYSKATVESTAPRVGGLVGMANQTAAAVDADIDVVINNCWFDGTVNLKTQNGQYAGGIVGLVMQNNVTISNSLNTGLLTCEADNAGIHLGGILGSDNNNATTNVLIENCLSAGPTMETLTASCVGVIVGRTRARTTYTIINTYGANESYTSAGNTPKHIGNKEGNVTIQDNVLMGKTSLLGTEAYKKTLLDFYVNEHDSGAWVARDNEVPALKAFAGTDILPDDDVTSLAGVEQNEWYDEDINTYYIGSVSAFKAFRDYVNDGKGFGGKTVYLTDDIDLNPGWTAPADTSKAVEGNPTDWTPIGNNSNKFQGTFDGQGHEIKGIYVDSDNNYVGLFGYVNNNATIKDLRLTNSYFYGDSVSALGWGSIAGQSDDATLQNIYSEAVMCYLGRQIGGLVGRSNKVVTVERCWFNGEIDASHLKADGNPEAIGVGGIVAVTAGGTLNITDCLNTGKVKSTATHSTKKDTAIAIGGIFGTDWAASNVTISGCLNKGELTTELHEGVGAIVGRAYGSKNANTISEYEITGCYALDTSITDQTFEDIGYINTNTDYHLSITPDTQEARCPSKEIGQLVGASVYEEGGLNLDYNVWVGRKSDVPVPRCFVPDIVTESETAKDETGRIYADTSWLTDGTGNGETAGTAYKLDSPADLLGLAQEVNKGNTFAGKFIELTADVDMNPDWTVVLNETTGKLSSTAPKNVWTPIAMNKKNAFAGTFNGNNKEIKGLYFVRDDETESYYGLFGVVASGATVKNFELTNSYFECKTGWLDGDKHVALMGSVAGEMRGTLENVYSKATIYNSNAQQAGGLAGRINDTNTEQGRDTGKDAVITKCWFDGKLYLKDSAGFSGGIAGVTLKNDSYIENCLFTGLVEYSGTSTSLNMGGILGKDQSAGKIYLKYCLSLGTVEGKNGSQAVNTSGSVAGNVSASGTNLTVTNVYAGKQCLKKNGTVNETAYGNFGGSVTNNISKNKKYGIIDETTISGALAANGEVLVDFDFANTWATITTADGVSKDGMPVLSYFKNWYLTNVLLQENE